MIGKSPMTEFVNYYDKVEQKDAGWDSEPGVFDFLNGEKDTVIYELKKFIQLLAGANPNILELLWLKLGC
jgi:uncharacterized protein